MMPLEPFNRAKNTTNRPNPRVPIDRNWTVRRYWAKGGAGNIGTALRVGPMGAMRTKLTAGAACVAIALNMGGVAQSQEIAPTGEYKEGVPIGSWLVFPKIF